MPKKGVKSRGNGQGCAIRLSVNNYKAIAVIGYNEEGNPIRRCKSGFKTKTEALAYIPQLKNPNNKKKTPINLMEAFQPPEITQPNSKSLIRETASWVEFFPLAPTFLRFSARIDTAIDTDKCYPYSQDGKLMKS